MNSRYLIVLALALSGCEKNATDNAAAVPMVVEQVAVPAGTFIRGSNKTDDTGMGQEYGFPAPLFVDEHPQQTMHVDAFMIDSYETSNAQYKAFILNSQHIMPVAWMSNGYAISAQRLQALTVEPLRTLAVEHLQLDIDTREMTQAELIAAIIEQQHKLDALPISGVTWFDAQAFCQWREGRLPTEAEWEKAARGVEGYEFPWGNKWDPALANTGDDVDWEKGIAPVGVYPKNVSPYGAYDMAGNVWEWTADWYQPYPGSDYQSAAFGKTHRVIRGGGGGLGHYAISYFFRGATRQFSEPEMASEDVGFRCVND